MADEGWYQIYHTYVPGPAHLLHTHNNGVSSVLPRQGAEPALLSAASRQGQGQFSGPREVARGDGEGIFLSLLPAHDK